MSVIYSGGFRNSVQPPETNAVTRRRSQREFVQSLAFGSLARANSKIPQSKEFIRNPGKESKKLLMLFLD